MIVFHARQIRNIFSALTAVLFILCVSYLSTAHAEQTILNINLSSVNNQHISFRRIPANQFSFTHSSLSITVNKSASFMLIPFNQIKHVHAVSFDWRSHGMLNLSSAEVEATREGDDARLRVGLMIHAQNTSFDSPLTPKWLKTVRDTLHFSSERMVYLIADAKHAVNSQWPNPYNNNVTMISIESQPQSEQWSSASYRFPSSLAIIGLWIMADGDNTQSSFISELKNLTLTIEPSTPATLNIEPK